jgi:hypothetical protein
VQGACEKAPFSSHTNVDHLFGPPPEQRKKKNKLVDIDITLFETLNRTSPNS